MLKFDHLRIPVRDLARSRAWYVEALGMTVEFEMAERGTVALQDTADFTIFLQQAEPGEALGGCAMWFQVDDVDAAFASWSARGVRFAHEPRKNFWGYGAELTDPDGRPIRLWDEHSMKGR